MLSCHNSRIWHQPNSINDEDDARAQMANLTIMQALLPNFADRKLRQGPFFSMLTDLHQSNIFVDSARHIKCLVDLERAASLAAETTRPPYWLTGRPVDDFIDENLGAFSKRIMDLRRFLKKRKSPSQSIAITRSGRASCDGAWRSEAFGAFMRWKLPRACLTYFGAIFSPYSHHPTELTPISRRLCRNIGLRIQRKSSPPSYEISASMRSATPAL